MASLPSGDYLLLQQHSEGPNAGGSRCPPNTTNPSDDNVYSDGWTSPRRHTEPLILDETDLETGRPLLQDKLCSFLRPRRLLLWTTATSASCGRWWCLDPVLRQPRKLRIFLYLIIGCLSVIGILCVIENTLHALRAYFPDSIEWILDHWGQMGEPTEGLARWPTDATADIMPINCHSHNDFWRRVPLYSAIYAGCTSVEADVWLVEGELHVGHRRQDLTANRTLRNLYINPLLELLEKQNPTAQLLPDEDYPLDPNEAISLNGIFDDDPTQSFVLMIDFKSSGPPLWWQLKSQLTPLREKGYLTHFNGSEIVERPIVVVGTGNTPFDFLAANDMYRDVFFDAPLEDLADLSSIWPNPNRAQNPTRRNDPTKTGRPDGLYQSTRLMSAIETRDGDRGQRKSSIPGDVSADIYNQLNSYYASASFTKSIGRIWGSRLTQKQLQLIRGQIRGAHRRGLKVRYWDVPQWPIGLRNHIWHILVREGVDVLNVDDLYGAARTEWRRRRSWAS